MKFNLFSIAFFCFSIAFSQNKGSISGIISDKESKNAPLAYANVSLKNTTYAVTTDLEGKYKISAESGNYTLQISFIGYETVEMPVTIKANENLKVNKSIGSGGYTLEDVVIKKAVSREKETALLTEQKKAVEIKQSIGAQELSRKGVSDVEEGLTKITGITKVESRGLFVRGLEDRYNYLLINELQSPSNSPFKKIIPLDLFPTEIVNVLTVYKTFNPNISGDFAGATVNIETIASKPITKLSVGLGYTTQNNGEEFLIASSANNTQGFFGFMANDRAIPAAFGNTPSGVKISAQEYNNSYNQNTWNTDVSSSPINSSISILHADKIKTGNGSFNYTISLNNENKYIIRKGVDRTFQQGSGIYDNNLYKEEYKYQTSTSALLGLKYKTNRFDIASNTLYLRSTESKIQDQLGYTNNQVSNPNIWIRMNQFEQSDYFNTQLLGNAKLGSNDKHTIKVGGSFVKTKFQQPDRKFIVGEKTAQGMINTSYGGNHLNRQYLDVKGNYYMSGLLEYAFKFKEIDNKKSNKVVIGVNSFRNDFSLTYRIFAGQRLFNVNYTAPIDQIDEYIVNDVNSGILFFREESNGDWKFKFNQFVNAGYANLFYNIGEKFEINGGVRAEQSNRVIKYRNSFDAITSTYRKLDENKLYFLPSINTKYALTDRANVRFSASKTITRPATMEISPIQYVSADGKVEKGNPELQDSQNINYDLKYEFFPSNKEMIAVGLFGKSLKNPIERVFIAGAGGSGQLTNFVNSDAATLYGAELELNLQLSRIFQALSNFSFGFNTSFLQTKVNVNYGVNSLENSPSRALQGASNWLINSDIKYEFSFNKTMKNTMNLVYGVYGDRIFAVGGSGIDHMYEKSFHKLDFIWNSKLSENIDVKFSADNILNPEYKLELGNNSKETINETSKVLESYKRGVGLSLSVSYTF
jgi:outer membrane receptor protein involved in Fe transport